MMQKLKILAQSAGMIVLTFLASAFVICVLGPIFEQFVK